MPDDIVLDTTITEPAWDADEAAMLRFALDRARAQFAWKVGDLTDEQLRRTHPPSTLTLGGLVKHLAQVEDRYVAEFLTGDPLGPPWTERPPGEPLHEWAYRSAADDSAVALYTQWRAAVARADAVWAGLLAAGDLDQPAALVLPDGARPNLRRVLVDTIEEYQRHTGQADLVREAIDGRVGNDPPQA